MPCPPGMRGCRRGCLHRQMVDEYRDWRINWEENREKEPNLQMEDDDYREAYPPPTFKAWLKGRVCDTGRSPEGYPG